jgi:hypothetical protein
MLTLNRGQFVEVRVMLFCQGFPGNFFCLLVPGMRSLSLSSFWGESGVHVVAYALPKSCKEHLISARKVLLDVELSHKSLKSYFGAK